MENIYFFSRNIKEFGKYPSGVVKMYVVTGLIQPVIFPQGWPQVCGAREP